MRSFHAVAAGPAADAATRGIASNPSGSNPSRRTMRSASAASSCHANRATILLRRAGPP
jgi:hypothetical protein